ncbi:peptide chain release factor N(5)-glutamine methyltransferase [Pseudodesulfovibrio senegalensis]|uniref:Release factor glutamine methyltransferase n=1 Tax=Pseudodesulfovibrio senegalensis TaxID=1721087 RepID=A0A6N6N8L0_9BACT|nr:peptide chain release factor N(5)-glutamine methyltransferase [Pseudodesulfovibrio senegalensis]KAB1443645.1 peptide chain release factor N(5)-glutamine methyltransferase [Pseudodesulfovibrio senegalensis]
MGPTVRQVLDESRQRLSAVDSPVLSAEVLIAHVLDVQRFQLHLDINRPLEEAQVSRIHELVARRAAGEPVAYLVGRQEFYGLDFSITPDVLIPRPETEHIVEYCEQLFDSQDSFVFADFGTGSGILAVTLAVLFPKSRGVAVDLLPGPLALARVNAKAHGALSRIHFAQADFTAPLFRPRSLDLVVSNPPYVTEEEYADCSPEVREFEPRTALTSGHDGLDHIRQLVPRVANALASGGSFLMEFGWRHGEAVRNILESQHGDFDGISINKDYSGHDRFVAAQKK